MNSITPLAFISHRTQDKDSQIAARFIKSELDEVFGEESIFMDADGLHIGNVWPQHLENRLNEATALIIIISEDWIKMSDKYGRRLIDNDKDWVRFEIENSLKRNIKILPILVRCEIPPQEALPLSIQPITNFQCFKLRVNDWRNDVEKLVDFLKDLNFVPLHNLDIQMPRAPRNKYYPLPFETEELKTELNGMNDWETIKLNIGIAIRKKYVFKSFKKAMQFMYELTGYINQMQHHPTWENTWRTVVVTLTTWDIGNKVTIWDIEMANHFDEFYKSNFS